MVPRERPARTAGRPRPFSPATAAAEAEGTDRERATDPSRPRWTCPRSSTRCSTLWRESETFETSARRRPRDRPRWTFYEGPPTANGRPGTHHVEARVFKDVFPRFQTMQGYLVERKAGWDCHGLPVELAVEKELGFSGKQDIEAYGVAEFNARCRESVLRHVDAFEEMTERMGYWVDTRRPLPHDGRRPTSSRSGGRSSRSTRKGLLVEDYRVAPYCPRCGTGLSDHELAQGYETVTDPQRLRPLPADLRPVRRREAGACWSWTTTPWTLVSNTAVAVRPDVDLRRRHRRRARPLVVAEPLFEAVLGEGWTVQRPVHGRGHGAAGPTSGRSSWWSSRPARPPTAPHFVVLADYVTTEDGTGLVHQSPAFGEDDMAVCRAYGLPVVVPGAARRPLRRRRRRWSAASSSSTPTPTWSSDLEQRGLLFRHVALRAQLPALLALPHAAACTTPSRPGTSAPPRSRTRCCARTSRPTWYPDTIKWGRYGDWLRQQHRLGAVAQPLLGHAAADLALRRGPPDLRRLAGRALRARPAPTSPGSTRTGRTSTR